MRVIIYGNSGSGKSTMASKLVDTHEDTSCLALDSIAFREGAERRPLAESVDAMRQFMAKHSHWVIEGCYGDLIEAALPECSELRFLNPGVDACIEHCLARPWEADKYDSDAAQQAMLAPLLDWVRQYPGRSDEFGLARHQQIFQAFSGAKREYVDVADY